MNADAVQKLQQLRSILAYHEHVGIKAYRKNKAIDTFFALRLENLTQDSGQAGMPSSLKETDSLKHERIPTDDTITELCEEICTCQSCELSKKRIVPVCGSGGKHVQLFVVGSWLATDQSPTMDGLVFGREEDQMLERMLKAINLSAEDVFVANVIKCGIADTVQPQAVHIETCISYLERQIALTSPKIICTMGTVATRALLKARQPLSQLRGAFHDYRLGGKMVIPLMPTYHPSFLLNNPEMKRPTWEDLQRIQKALIG